jgi:hypothetical protein
LFRGTLITCRTGPPMARVTCARSGVPLGIPAGQAWPSDARGVAPSRACRAPDVRRRHVRRRARCGCAKRRAEARANGELRSPALTRS